MLHYRGGVLVDLRDARHIAARMRSHRALTGSVLLAVLVVAAAGIAGTTHFAGPRWLPHWKLSRPSAGARTRCHPCPRRSQPPTTVPKAHRQLPTWGRWCSGSSSRSRSSASPCCCGDGGQAGRPGRRPAGTRSRWPRRRRSLTEPEPEPDMPALRTGIELALQVLDEQREPADAIVRAWLGLQETAEESGIVRQPAETPTEFTSRILSRAFADDRAVRTLLRLYLRTRFGDHPVTTDDVAAVRAALQELVRTWPTPESPAEPDHADMTRRRDVTVPPTPADADAELSQSPDDGADRIRTPVGAASSGPASARAAGDDRTLLTALLVAAVCWYFGADVWHSILLGSALTTLGVVGLVANDDPDFSNTDWRG